MPRFTLTVRTADRHRWRSTPRAPAPAPTLDVGWHTSFALLPGEAVLLSCGATPSFLSDGKLYLTDQRLIFTPRLNPLGKGRPLVCGRSVRYGVWR